MDQAFYTDERGWDLLRWSGNLVALGNVISALGFHANKYGDETLDWNGEQLGSIVKDYAEAIHQTAERISPTVNEIYRQNGMPEIPAEEKAPAPAEGETGAHGADRGGSATPIIMTRTGAEVNDLSQSGDEGRGGPAH